MKRMHGVVVGAFVAFMVVTGACGDDKDGASGAADDTTVGDDGVDTSAGDDATSSDGLTGDAWVAAVDGRYSQGVYLCCAPGEDRDEACPPDTLPDPDHGRSATCFGYGGVGGACTVAGDMLEGKDICATCCDDLVRIDNSAPVGAGGACEETAPPSLLVCAACPDGTCGTGENKCNCPADCQ
jgi:hypothetical protein